MDEETKTKEQMQEEFDRLQMKILAATGTEKERFEHESRILEMKIKGMKDTEAATIDVDDIIDSSY